MDISTERYLAAVELIKLNDQVVTARRAVVEVPEIVARHIAVTVAAYDQLTRRSRRKKDV
jgi:hypothetical protein